ncbi:MAG: hypothetical protein Q4A76_03415 [Porphyromonadaceae bacterium]|nr:hypothetical protein [Porphyromonadaceae bacterium]
MNKNFQIVTLDSFINEENKRIKKENTINRLRFLKNWMESDIDIDITTIDEIYNLENILHYEFFMNWDDINNF